MFFSATFESLYARLRSPGRSAACLEEEVTRWFLDERKPVIRYVMALGLGLADGEDIAQDVFLALFHHLRQGRAAPNPRGWIFRVARNLALKRRAAIGRVALMRESPAPVDPAPDPETRVEWADEQARLLAIVNALPERDRCCLALRAEGLTYREIAEALDMSLGAVATAITRSLEKLTAASRAEAAR